VHQKWFGVSVPLYDDIFGHSFSPVAVMLPTREQTKLLSKRLKEEKKKRSKEQYFHDSGLG